MSIELLLRKAMEYKLLLSYTQKQDDLSPEQAKLLFMFEHQLLVQTKKLKALAEEKSE